MLTPLYVLQYEKHLEATGQQPSHEFFKEYAWSQLKL